MRKFTADYIRSIQNCDSTRDILNIEERIKASVMSGSRAREINYNLDKESMVNVMSHFKGLGFEVINNGSFNHEWDHLIVKW